jgi:hypothetical protein
MEVRIMSGYMSHKLPCGIKVSNGNEKLGRIANFNLPPVETCPGASDACRKVCYARKAQRMYHNARDAWADNYACVMRDAEWIVEMVEYINTRKIKVFRIHTSGDFFDEPYIMAWWAIARACPDTKFYAYTRSWVCKSLHSALNFLHDLPNVQLFASWDDTMGLSALARIESLGWRVAVMGDPVQFDDGDVIVMQGTEFEIVKRQTPRTCYALRDKDARGYKANCETCGYCYYGKRGNVRFPLH